MSVVSKINSGLKDRLSNVEYKERIFNMELF